MYNQWLMLHLNVNGLVATLVLYSIELSLNFSMVDNDMKG